MLSCLAPTLVPVLGFSPFYRWGPVRHRLNNYVKVTFEKMFFSKEWNHKLGWKGI